MMMRRIAIALLCLLPLAADATNAWWTTKTTHDAWTNLMAGVRERCEATYYGEVITTSGAPSTVSTTRLYQCSPPIFTNTVALSLGTVTSAPPAFDWFDFFSGVSTTWMSDSAVRCETNVHGQTTNVWCWTNLVAATTATRVFTDDTHAVHYWGGPTIATNLAVDVPASLRTAWPHLADRYELHLPSHDEIARLDASLVAMLPHYVDMQAVGTNVEAYLATDAVTNWYWIDTDGDFEADQWHRVTSPPQELPHLTAEKAWAYAGIEPFLLSRSIETQYIGDVYGWEVGALDAHTVFLDEYRVVTNNVWDYRFTRQASNESFRRPLATLQAAVTNDGEGGTQWVAFVVGNAHPGLAPQYVPSRIINDSARVTLALTVGHTNAMPEDLPPVLVTVSGLVASVRNDGSYELNIETSEAVAVTFGSNAVCSRPFYHVTSLGSAWTRAETTGQVDTAVGAQIEVVYSNVAYALGPPGWAGAILSNAVAERARVARLCAVTDYRPYVTTPMQLPGRGPTWTHAWTWSGWRLTNYLSTSGSAGWTEQHTDWSIITCENWYCTPPSPTSGETNTAAGTPGAVVDEPTLTLLAPAGVVSPVPPPYAARGHTTFEAFEYLDTSHSHSDSDDCWYCISHSENNARSWGGLSSASSSFRLDWPIGEVDLLVSNLSPSVGATIELFARLASNDEEPVRLVAAGPDVEVLRAGYRYPFAVTNVVALRYEIDPAAATPEMMAWRERYVTSVVAYAGDFAGAWTNALSALAVAPKAASQRSVRLSVDYAEDKDIDTDGLTTVFDAALDETAEEARDSTNPSSGVRTHSTASRHYKHAVVKKELPETDRRVYGATLVVRWNFQHLAD